MATVKETKVNEIINELGFEPLEGKCIVVKFAPPNLSAKLIDFFIGDFFVLQLCKNEVVLVPFSKMTIKMEAKLEKEPALVISKTSIKSVEIQEDGLNYSITITTDTDQITLTAQQKEVNFLRSSGGLTAESMQMGILPDKNWHADNLDGVLIDLKNISEA